ncbi:hypothetical protein F2Q70_00012126 [Brassica cretica]|uniref:Uncharacterized protein n=1 Tax=Brassica cretica TaxID=69181 RepID=A0A3N6SCF1_BRACR|nr:hypothetical protein F2Q70_00012126 [Brassica cretica]KAF3543773.1 hypothetical protein DY000_02007935 [Brassica cretica]
MLRGTIKGKANKSQETGITKERVLLFDDNKYEGNHKSGFKRPYRDQDGGYSKNLRQTGRFTSLEVPVRYAIDTHGLKKLNTQEMGQHLDEQQNLMLDAFKSGKSGETNQISASKARKALTFEGNSSGTAMEGLDGTYGASGTDGMSVEEAEPKALEEKLLLPDSFTEAVEQVGSEQVGDAVRAEADFDVEEDDQLMETETEEVGESDFDVEEDNQLMETKTEEGLPAAEDKVSFPHERNTMLSRGVRWGEKGMPPPYKATSRNAEDGFLSGITACCGSWYYISRDLRVTRCGSSG